MESLISTLRLAITLSTRSRRRPKSRICSNRRTWRHSKVKVSKTYPWAFKDARDQIDKLSCSSGSQQKSWWNTDLMTLRAISMVPALRQTIDSFRTSFSWMVRTDNNKHRCSKITQVESLPVQTKVNVFSWLSSHSTQARACHKTVHILSDAEVAVWSPGPMPIAASSRTPRRSKLGLRDEAAGEAS